MVRTVDETTTVLQITPSERTALQMIADGQPNRDIADRLCVSEHALDTVLDNLCARMGTSNRHEAVAAAVRRGIVSAEAPASHS